MSQHSQTQKHQPVRDDDTVEVDGAAGEATAGAAEALVDSIDALVDEIDGILEENAEQFVRDYVQRGGQ